MIAGSTSRKWSEFFAKLKRVWFVLPEKPLPDVPLATQIADDPVRCVLPGFLAGLKSFAPEMIFDKLETVFLPQRFHDLGFG